MHVMEVRPERSLVLLSMAHAVNHAFAVLLPLIFLAIIDEFGVGVEAVAFLAASGAAAGMSRSSEISDKSYVDGSTASRGDFACNSGTCGSVKSSDIASRPTSCSSALKYRVGSCRFARSCLTERPAIPRSSSVGIAWRRTTAVSGNCSSWIASRCSVGRCCGPSAQTTRSWALER